VVDLTASLLRRDRPIHLLGIGGVRDIFHGVRQGACVRRTVGMGWNWIGVDWIGGKACASDGGDGIDWIGLDWIGDGGRMSAAESIYPFHPKNMSLSANPVLSHP